MGLVIRLYMNRYILLILILFILFGSLRLIGVEWSKHNNLANPYITTIANNGSKKTGSQKELILPRLIKWKKYKLIKDKNLFSWLIKERVQTNSWEYYKKTFISDDGRVIDPQRGSVTTSEGQAYAMRRALMMNDKVTFDKTYNWAKYNLQHKHNKLFAWLWGQKNPGEQREMEYGIIDQNGATDAGTEIAIALILASKIWEQESYMNDALSLMKDIWNKETIEVKGERILISGVNQNRTENVEVNPSYFMPFGFRIFAEVDEDHDWQRLVDSSYRLTNWCIDHIKSELPPDVFYINRNTGVITFKKDKSDFSYDAVRVFYRFYVDYTITKDPRAEKLLSRSKIFITKWKREKKFYTNYKQNGQLKDYNEAIGSIALLLPVIKMYDKKVAAEIYQNRIKAKYHSKGYWSDPMDYYAQNLVWFGVWLYQNEENVRSFKY